MSLKWQQTLENHPSYLGFLSSLGAQNPLYDQKCFWAQLVIVATQWKLSVTILTGQISNLKHIAMKIYLNHFFSIYGFHK